MRSNKSKSRKRCLSVPIISLLSLYPLLLLIFPIPVISRVAGAEHSNIHKNPHSYVVQKLRSHDIVFLGTKHKKEAILQFVSGLIPHLHETRTTHIGLEIFSDQQDNIERFLQAENGLDEINIHPLIDCVEYRTLFTTIRSLGKSKRPTVVALDLPESRYQGKINRDEWMARSIAKIFHRNPNAKLLVVVGNLHILKKIEWEDGVSNPHGFICSYLNELTSHLSMFSIGQCIDESPKECDFTREFSQLEGAVAMDCDGRFAGWKIGIMSPVAAKPIQVYELLDGVIVY